ncbi:MAG: 5-dehydro-2-deoxygluconokinase [Alphaproteobacteria bacterium]|jgi:5-dehydro-2-deoxygluconokinase|nr:5-dehydro-2-deoxygluconokinase [Alphaproteobacteria bacterium]|tara:strand:+ start:1388 stop:3298 length:1911 start_codon:yes stop_codon:yes gene_type:complete
MTHKFDVITIGRSSVDLYGAQVGGRLEEMGSFNKYIGGSPTNIACGTARLGLKSAIITAVGNEHMGRFIKEQLQKEGVSIQGVKTDPERLTALVLLGIRDNEQFPLIFYRENCADMGLTPEDIDAHFIASASCICATGTHLSHSQVEAATLKALRIARENKIKTALDIDYRPNLWGVAGHGEGESRFVESEQVTKKLQSTLGLFDLIVGTEEEFHIAGGTIDTIEALRNVRKISNATLICKRGPMGAAAFEGEIPDSLDEGQTGPGFKIDVFNVLGAGDGFMSGLLRGWLTGKQWPVALTYANACGALAVSRHGCTPAYPSWDELQFFLDRGIINTELRNDPELAQIHWSTNRPNRQNPLEKPSVRIFAFDHRSQMQDIDGATPTKIALFKKLCLQAAIQISAHNDGFGILCDERLGKETLYQASDYNLWIGRPAELPGSHPLRFEPQIGLDCGGLAEWPRNHIVKCLCFAHPDDEAAMWDVQLEQLLRLYTASRRNNLEFLLEIIPSKIGKVNDETTAQVMRRFYAAGIFPDWWKLEPTNSQSAWQNITQLIKQNDPHIQGIVILGLEASEEVLAHSFSVAAQQPFVRGFAVGRTIFAESAKSWMSGKIDDSQAIREMSQKFKRLCDLWDAAYVT